MATVVSQHVRHIMAAIFDFSKCLFYEKLQQILLKLVENICLQPQVGIWLRIDSKKSN